jgi:hypothetical protein
VNLGPDDSGQEVTPDQDTATPAGSQRSALASFDPTTVVLTRRPLAGFTATVAGAHPRDARLDGLDPASPDGAIELSILPSARAVVERYVRDIQRRWEGIPAAAILGGDLRVDIWSVSSPELLVADLRTNPILWRVNAKPERLQALRFVSDAPEWELVDIVTTQLGADAFEVPPASGDGGRDYVVRTAAVPDVQFERLGTLQDLAPRGPDLAIFTSLERLIARLFRAGSSDPEA